jgi:hypothetical protein
MGLISERILAQLGERPRYKPQESQTSEDPETGQLKLLLFSRQLVAARLLEDTQTRSIQSLQSSLQRRIEIKPKLDAALEATKAADLLLDITQIFEHHYLWSNPELRYSVGNRDFSLMIGLTRSDFHSVGISEPVKPKPFSKRDPDGVWRVVHPPYYGPNLIVSPGARTWYTYSTLGFVVEERNRNLEGFIYLYLNTGDKPEDLTPILLHADGVSRSPRFGIDLNNPSQSARLAEDILVDFVVANFRRTRWNRNKIEPILPHRG